MSPVRNVRQGTQIKRDACCLGGEVLAELQIKAGRPKKNEEGGPPITKKSAAKAAGLSPDQAKEMLCVAAVSNGRSQAI
jgi:hypothetical protein